MQDLIDEIAATLSTRTDRGAVADYIPELAKVDPDQFGIAIAMADGSLHLAGDAETPFSIQSVSKVFALALALGRVGDQLWRRVGREPSGQSFNSMLLLEREEGIPRNPFINAGALVTTDTYLAGSTPREALGHLLRFVRAAADDEAIHINQAVARSELETAHRNFALAHYLASFGNLQNGPDKVLGTYCHQCAIDMSCRQLALAGRFLIEGKGFPRLLTRERQRRINALMMTCGHYDGSGDFAFRVGLPGKSGVGGGILAIAPGRASIAVWSPGLNRYGNSSLGTEAMEILARRTGWSVFG
ncbi:glutaminase [Microvirga tunisiensis]|uniref:Glutaminase n=2 Tax=Pannonibacter tanglangensis TaxID=2750084 RepID=A0ABW9ZP29_9HYPH|nr:MULTISPECIES: glutaminase [unclassified Pannonibacter]NBN65662.1 glutaminase [Pannonibacter sp. XCT-34]NBN80111.1 glutaminase [Pannonibacter sp. XCT-53]